MIQNFTFTNVFSFREKQSVSFTTEGLKELKEHIHTKNTNGFKEDFLKSIAIYGHNSHGKSNVIKAIQLFKDMLKTSFTQPNTVLVEPFLLNTSSINKPSYFEIVLYINDIKYRYGFEILTNKIISEWLFYATPGVRENHLFQRVEQEYSISKTWNKEYGNKIEVQAIPFAKPNVLLLSVLVALDYSPIKEIFEKIDNIILINEINNSVIEKAVLIFSDNKYQEDILKFIKKADLGFTTIFDKIEQRLKESNRNAEWILNNWYEDEIKNFELYTNHDVFNEQLVKVESVKFEMLKKESDGSIKFFILISLLIYAIKNELLICVDELDSKLHTDLLELVISEFHNPNINYTSSQLIFTTHNTTLLDKQLRRDQYCVVEKNTYGESNIRKMHTKDSPIRIDSSMEKEYRKGNLGGVSKKLKENNSQTRLFE